MKIEVEKNILQGRHPVQDFPCVDISSQDDLLDAFILINILKCNLIQFDEHSDFGLQP